MSITRQTVRLDFCDFWPGYRKDDNFFYNLLKTRYKVELTDQPDYVIYADPGSHQHRLHTCVRIFFGVESYLPDWSTCDYALTCHYLDDPRQLRLPYYVLFGGQQELDKTGEDPAAVLAAKTRFCGFVVSNAGNPLARKRVDFFQALSRYKRVDSGGKVLNNIGGPLGAEPQAKIRFLKSCKFNIAFENAPIPGYTTEKLYEAMVARALPIYWGNPRIAEEFNTRSFLNYADFGSEEALIRRIIELDTDDAQYLELLRQPYLVDNRPNEFFDMERVLRFFDRIFSTPIRPVARRRRWFRLGRWQWVKRNRIAGP